MIAVSLPGTQQSPMSGPAQRSMFCAERTVPGKLYCQEHLKLCYAPRSTRNSVDKIIERLATVAARESEMLPVGFELNKAAPVWQDHVADGLQGKTSLNKIALHVPLNDAAIVSRPLSSDADEGPAYKPKADHSGGGRHF
jgi:hypothetical protein